MKSALVTGGSSGIGAATATALALAGYRVYAASRRGGAPAHENIIPVALDVNDYNATLGVVERIASECGSLDVLVANAGNGIGGSFEDTSTDEAKAQFETCLFGLSKSMRAVLPQMRSQGGGRIITIGSVASFIPIPFQGYYSAVKAGVLSLTQSLSLEVKPFGIQCCCILPGDVKTGFTSARKVVSSISDPYRERTAKSIEKMEKDEQGGMPPEKIAKEVVRQLGKRMMSPSVTPRIDYKLIRFLWRVMPQRFALWVVGLLYG